MPEIVMSRAESPVTCPLDITNQIKELSECMDHVDVMPDGFSDSDDSVEMESSLTQPISKHTSENISTEKRMLHTLGLKNGLFERHAPLKVYKNKKSEESFDQHPKVRPKSTGTTSRSVKLKRQTSEVKTSKEFIQNENEHSATELNDSVNSSHGDTPLGSRNNTSQHVHHRHHEKNSGKHHHHSNHHHNQHHHHHHHRHHHRKDHNDKSSQGHKDKENVDSTDSETLNKQCFEGENFDPSFFEIISAGQFKDNVDVPIMSTPLPEVGSSFPTAPGSMYTRPMSFRYLFAGETLSCDYNDEKHHEAKDALLSEQTKDLYPVCFCSSLTPFEDSFSGWDAPQRANKAKIGRRKRSFKPISSDVSFNRLTQTMGKDPVIFQHYSDNSKYIERYRFYHTVGNVGRPSSYSKYAESGVNSDPYYSKMKSHLTSAMTSAFYGLASHLRDEHIGSASSRGSVHEKSRSDDESLEDSSVDARPFSLRDRGKTLNLAPVRECSVPNLRSNDKIDITELNKYLNLSTPPVPNNCLRYSLDEVRGKRSGHQNEQNTSSARRGARTLRLGSAEFVKPGTPDCLTKWNAEKRNKRASTVPAGSTQGNLIVGSTVSSPVPPKTARARSGGKTSPYVQFQKEHSLAPSTPPQHISGQGFKVSERVTELHNGKDRGRFSYTHAQQGERTSPIVRTATAIDFKEAYIPRDRSRTITLDVNHLGIRGQQYKQREQIVLYKNRRAQIAKT